jgi:hypothetical protein
MAAAGFSVGVMLTGFSITLSINYNQTPFNLNLALNIAIMHFL